MTTTNTYGRQVVVPLVNKSGGGVIAGDVVVVDTTNNDAFTTSTAGAFTGLVGVAQETIASNATGRVATAGYVALVNTSASVTRGNFGKTHTVAKQAVDAGSTRAAGTFCQFLTGGTTPDAHLFGLADNTSGAGTGTFTTIKDEGSNLSTAVVSADFVGAGVTATGTTAVTVTIPGGMKITDRQGGSATDWSSPGSTNRSVTGIATIQAGSSASVTVGSTLTVTFPVAFTNPPVVVCSVEGLTVDGTGMNVQLGSITATNFVIHMGGVSTATGTVRWVAIGI